MPPRLPSPLPKSLRLVSARPLRGKHPPVPFGLQWSEAQGGGVGVVLDLGEGWPTSGFGDVDRVVAQLPDPAALVPGQLVLVLPRGAPKSAWLGRLPGTRSWAAVAVRASALLARGYVGIGAGVDPKTRMDLVWGYAARD
jgi:hypothetical protein